MPFALEQVHAIEAKAFYFHNGVGGFGAWFGDGGVDEEGGCGPGTVFDIWNLEH